MLPRDSFGVFERERWRYQDSWYRYARFLLANHGCGSDAKDIVQDAYVASFEAAPLFIHVRAAYVHGRLMAFHRWLSSGRRFVGLDGGRPSVARSSAPPPTDHIVTQGCAAMAPLREPGAPSDPPSRLVTNTPASRPGLSL
jgi:DNA-directed RNA polymerase specialized sigma24 family protein